MSEQRRECDRFDQWLREAEPGSDSTAWLEHLDGCAECQGQWHSHELLTASLAVEAVPELSPGFEARLRRRVATEMEVRPLRGWRRAAMLAYAAGAAALLFWALRGVPLPAIDLTSPWVIAATLTALPWTFLLAIGASRWLPGSGWRQGGRPLAL